MFISYNLYNSEVNFMYWSQFYVLINNYSLITSAVSNEISLTSAVPLHVGTTLLVKIS